MTLTFESDNQLLVVRFSGRLDGVTSIEAQKELFEKWDDAKQHLILDLSGLEYLSSAGLRLLLTASRRASEKKVRAAVVVKHPSILEILQISGFNSLVPVYEELDIAKKIAEG